MIRAAVVTPCGPAAARRVISGQRTVIPSPKFRLSGRACFPCSSAFLRPVGLASKAHDAVISLRDLPPCLWISGSRWASGKPYDERREVVMENIATDSSALSIDICVCTYRRDSLAHTLSSLFHLAIRPQ